MNKKTFSNMLEPPQFQDEEKQRVAAVIRGFVINIGIAVAIGTAGVLFIFEEKTISAIALSALFIAGLVTQALSKRGHIHASSIVLLTTLWMITLALVSVSDGMRSLDIIFFITGTTLAGLLLGQRGMFYYGGASIAAGILFLILDMAEVVLPNLFTFPPQTGLVLLLINIAFLIPALNTTLHTLHNAVEQANQRLKEQEKIQEKLRYSEEKFSKVFHASPMAILIQRVSDRRYTDVNEAFTNITGYSREDALGHTPLELHLYPNEEAQKQMREVFFAQGYIRDHEIPFRRKNGEFGTALAWAENIKIQGEDTAIVGITDITEQKKLETQQINQTQEISALYEALSEITTIHGDVTQVSQKITGSVVNMFHAYKCSLWLLTEDETALTRIVYSGQNAVEHINDIPIDASGLVTLSFNSKESIYEPDVSSNPSFMMVDETTRSEFVVPLHAQDKVIGVLNMESPEPDGFSERTRRLVETFAQNAALALQSAKLVDSLEASITKLKEAQTRINFFLEHTAEGVYRYDYDPPIPIDLPFQEQYKLGVERGVIGECNDAFAKMYGASSKEEILNKSIKEFYGDEGYDINLDENLDFFHQGYKAENLETEELNAKGETVHFLSNIVGIIRDGYFVSTWGTQRDITPLRQALEEREKLNEDLEKKLSELKESQERINFFLSNTSEGVYRVDYEPPIPIDIPYEEQYKLSRERGRFGECNEAIAQMYGFNSREEMLNSPYYDEDTEHPEGYEVSLKAVTDFYRNGYKADESETEEYTLNGEKAYFLNNAVGIVKDGYFMSIWGTQRDITPLKEALAELEERNAELERFNYTLSHELRTPLVTIRGFLGYLEESITNGNIELAKTDLGRIGDATDKMYDMINELLQLSRIGHIINPPQDVSFNEIVQAGITNTESMLKKHNVQVHVQPNLPTVHVDRIRTIEVIQNLVENAIKYIGNQSDPKINIGIRADGDDRVFFVNDNGIGIEPQFQKRVFNIFEKLNPKSEGTGIGLAIIKRIIETHGGKIWVESEGTDKGSTFCFTLPMAKAL